MEFASEYVYHYDAPEFEYISDEELDEGMNVSDDEDVEEYESLLDDEAVPPPPPGQALGGTGAPPPGQGESQTVGGTGAPAPPPPPPPPMKSVPTCSIPKEFKSEGTRGRFRLQKKAHHWRSTIPDEALDTGEQAHHWRSTIPDEALDTAVPLAPPPPQPPRSKGQRVRQADTNVVSIKFDKLIAPSSMHAGDPQVCEGCSAILSKISKVTTEGDQRYWDCEFCEHRNVVDIEDEEIPTDEDVTFMLEPALSTTASGPSGMDEALVVFCVDISGSMCVTTEVPGHVALRGAESLRRAQSLNREREDQFLPRQRRDVTYISRLQSAQAAIDHQLQEMEKEYPNRRVALVTFNDEVTVIGDGKSDPVSIAGDKLKNKDTLKSIAAEQTMPAAIKTTRKSLGEKVFGLEEGGPTALGPALLVSTEMASKCRGSKVILCTDGLANVGMGKLDNYKDDVERDECTQFYEDIANTAADNGVSISVITIKGTDCRLVELGKMADKTSGQVNIVDPLKLTQEFSTILANKIIATNVVATFILHKELFFFYEETEESKVVKNVGNVTADTEITFEFGVKTKPKPKTEKRPKPDERLNTLREASMEVSQIIDTSAADDRTIADEKIPADTSEIDSAEPIVGTSQQATTGQTKTPSDDQKKADENMQTDPSEKDSAEPVAGPSNQATAGQRKTPSELPFQLQVVYTDTEGAKAMRLLTKTKPVTKYRYDAEKACNLKVLSSHTAQTAAKFALEGQYTMSRERAFMNQRVAWRHTETDEGRTNKKCYKHMFGKIRSMENYLNEQQKEEVRKRGRTYSRSSSDSDDSVRAGPSRKLYRRGQRQTERSSRGRTYSDDSDSDEEEREGATKEAKESKETKEAKAPKSFFGAMKKGFKTKKARSAATSDSMADFMYKGKSSKFFEDPDTD